MHLRFQHLIQALFAKLKRQQDLANYTETDMKFLLPKPYGSVLGSEDMDASAGRYHALFGR